MEKNQMHGHQSDTLHLFSLQYNFLSLDLISLLTISAFSLAKENAHLIKLF